MREYVATNKRRATLTLHLKIHIVLTTRDAENPSDASNSFISTDDCEGVAMVMSITMTPPPLIFLLMIHGVYSAADGWSVSYSSSHICPLKDSTVTINCTYKYPTGQHITEVFWTKHNRHNIPNLFIDSEYRERIQYLGDKQHDCSVRLTDVRHTDSHEYYFRFITDKDKWIGKPGVTLNITDLQVESEGETVMEGHSMTLTCKSRCSLTDTSTFIWFRYTQTLNDTNKKLILPSVRRENAGDYRCAVQGHKLTSNPRHLNVISGLKRLKHHLLDLDRASELQRVDGSTVCLRMKLDLRDQLLFQSLLKET